MEFVYDADLVRELAEELVPSAWSEAPAWVRYQRAGIEAYCEIYDSSFLSCIAESYDEVRGDSPEWASLTNGQRHRLLATIALHHSTADQDYFDDEWCGRIAMVIGDDIASDPAFAIG